jgi:hypothetical protein
MAAAKFADSDALNRGNQWVKANLADISPRCTTVCMQCGKADVYFCEHAVKPELIIPDEEDLNAGLEEEHQYHAPSLRERINNLFRPSKFDFSQQNNRRLADFNNDWIDDANIVAPLYNYLTTNMQTSYVVNGCDNREVRLAHCHRLFLKWGSSCTKTLMSDTQFKNRCLFTVQRACDQAELPVLYKYNSPISNFGIAWLPKLVLLLLFLIYLLPMSARFVLPQVQLWSTVYAVIPTRAVIQVTSQFIVLGSTLWLGLGALVLVGRFLRAMIAKLIPY